MEASNVINIPKCKKCPKCNEKIGLKCYKGPKCNTDWVLNVIKVLNLIKFGPQCNKPLVLNVVSPLLHLGPNIEALNVIKVSNVIN